MKLILPIAFGFSVIALSGCMNNIEATTSPVNPSKERQVVSLAKTLVADKMRDPEATRFKESFQTYQTNRGDFVVCGTVNGKNAMGGYVGYKPFYARIRNNTLVAFQLPSESDEYGIVLNAVKKSCADAATGKLMVSS